MQLTILILAIDLASLATAQLRDPINYLSPGNPNPATITITPATITITERPTMAIQAPPTPTSTMTVTERPTMAFQAPPAPTSTMTVTVAPWIQDCCTFSNNQENCDPDPECIYNYAGSIDNPYYEPPPRNLPVGDASRDNLGSHSPPNAAERFEEMGQEGYRIDRANAKEERRRLERDKADFQHRPGGAAAAKVLRRGLVDDAVMKDKCKGIWKSDKKKHIDVCQKEEASERNTCMLISLLRDASEECKAAMVKAMGFRE